MILTYKVMIHSNKEWSTNTYNSMGKSQKHDAE